MFASFTGPGNSDPIAYMLRVRNAASVTVGDCLWGGQYIRTAIRKRAAAGVDVNGVAFAPYSKAYAAQKAKQLGHSDTVDLFGAGRGTHMLNGILVKVGGQQVTDYNGSPNQDTQPSSLFEVGLYDEQLATRARIHNYGGQFRTQLGIGSTSIGGQYPLFSSGSGTRFTGVSKKIRAAYGNMPKREWFGANDQNVIGVEQGIGARQLTRLAELPQ